VYNDYSTHKDYPYGMLRQTVRAVVIAKTRNPGSCEITELQNLYRNTPHSASFTVEKQAYCLARYCGPWVAQQADQTLGTILPSAGGNTSTHYDALQLPS